MPISDFGARVRGRFQRSAARLLFRRPLSVATDVPLISFTFDDFPRSALLNGGAILERFGVRGSYYASFGLMGSNGPTGPLFLREDVGALLHAEHELGCHTFGHCHSWDTQPREFVSSVDQNRQALKKYFPEASFRTLAYPLSPPRPWSKRMAGPAFACCRGGGQTFNAGTIDLSNLAACFIEQVRSRREALKDLVDRNAEARGWLIFATHDVCENPTAFGCTPELFEDLVAYAVRSGARVLPVIGAFEALYRASTNHAVEHSHSTNRPASARPGSKHFIE
jgi:peptidoglycan/xylan/chitin deacetylase (PgdA/CDA1 family)